MNYKETFSDCIDFHHTFCGSFKTDPNTSNQMLKVCFRVEGRRFSWRTKASVFGSLPSSIVSRNAVRMLSVTWLGGCIQDLGSGSTSFLRACNPPWGQLVLSFRMQCTPNMCWIWDLSQDRNKQFQFQKPKRKLRNYVELPHLKVAKLCIFGSCFRDVQWLQKSGTTLNAS